MHDYAQAEFELDVRLEDGSSERDNLVSAAKQGNRQAIDKLAGMPTIPAPLAYLWAYFKEIRRTRQHNGWSFNHICYSEIEAWCRLCNVKLDHWELDAILGLDAIFMNAMANAKKGSS